MMLPKLLIDTTDYNEYDLFRKYWGSKCVPVHKYMTRQFINRSNIFQFCG